MELRCSINPKTCIVKTKGLSRKLGRPFCFVERGLIMMAGIFLHLGNGIFEDKSEGQKTDDGLHDQNKDLHTMMAITHSFVIFSRTDRSFSPDTVWLR